MQYWRCKCGYTEIRESGMSPQPCETCEKCGSTLAQDSEGHAEPQPHEEMTMYDIITGKSFTVCMRCHTRL